MTALWQAALPPLPPDSVRAALRHVFAAREYDWHPSVRESFLSKLFVLVARVLAWFDQLHETHPAGYWILIGLMVAMLLAILAHFGTLVWRAFHPAPAAARPLGGEAAEPHDAEWHLAEARRLGLAGRYADALGHRFLALVLELERRRLVQFHRSKTPAEYVADAQLGEAQRRALAELVGVLYRHLFGGAPCDAAVWSDFQQRAELVGSRVATD